MPSPRRAGSDPAAAFGAVLRDFRRATGMTQEAVAFACGLSREYVSLLERGKNLPSVSTLLALAEAMGTRPSEIFRRFEALSAD